MTSSTSKLLRDFHEQDQKRRREIIKQQGTEKISEAENKEIFLTLKKECEERARAVLILIRNKALKEKDDFYYAAAIIINVGSLKNFIIAYRLIKKYRELGGKKPWGFYDDYFKMQNWGKTKNQVEKLVEKKIGIHPSKLDKFK